MPAAPPPAGCWEGRHRRRRGRFAADLGKPGLSPVGRGRDDQARCASDTGRLHSPWVRNGDADPPLTLVPGFSPSSCLGLRKVLWC